MSRGSCPASLSVMMSTLKSDTGAMLVFEYFGQSKRIFVQFDGSSDSPYLLVTMQAVRFAPMETRPDLYVYAPECGNFHFTIGTDKEKYAPTYHMVSDNWDWSDELHKFSLTDTIDLHDAVVKVVANIAKRHFALRDHIFPDIIKDRGIFERIKDVVAYSKFIGK